MSRIVRIIILPVLMLWVSCSDADRLVGPDTDSGFDVLTKAGSVNRPGMLLASNGNSDNTGTLLSLDPSTGAGTVIGGFPFPMVSLEFSSQDGKLYGLMTVNPGPGAKSQLVVIDPDDGSLTPVGFVKDAANPSIDYFVAAMGFDGGDLYMIHNTGTSTPDLLIKVNPATALATVVGPLSHEVGNTGGTVENGVFYMLARQRPGGVLGDVALFEVDLSTGASTLIGSTGIAFNALGLTVSGDGRMLGTILDSLYEIDRSTGAASLIGPTGLNLVAGLGFVDTIDRHCPHGGPVGGGTWKNHGQYVSCVAKVLNQLKKDGVITGKEKGVLQQQAAQSDIGK